MTDDEDSLPELRHSEGSGVQLRDSIGIVGAQSTVHVAKRPVDVEKSLILPLKLQTRHILQKEHLRSSLAQDTEVLAKCIGPRIAEPKSITGCPVARLGERLTWWPPDQESGLTHSKTCRS
jgi:hypothetical protein